jgi:hypothetical protein
MHAIEGEEGRYPHEQRESTDAESQATRTQICMVSRIVRATI